MTHRALITQDDVRKAGGIVHRDGNIFFTNIDQLNESARQYLAAPEEEELCCDRCNDVLTEGNAGICANCVMPDTLAVQYAKLAQHCAMLESKLAAPEQSEPVAAPQGEAVDERCKNCLGEGIDGEDSDGINSAVTWVCADCNGTGFIRTAISSTDRGVKP